MKLLDVCSQEAGVVTVQVCGRVRGLGGRDTGSSLKARVSVCTTAMSQNIVGPGT